GFGFVLLAAAALLVNRKWYWIQLCAIGVVFWDVSGWVLTGKQGEMVYWLRDNWPYAAQSVYDRKSIFHFVMLMPAVVSPLVFPAMVIGIGRILRDRGRWIVAGIPLLILVVHSVLT